MLTKIHFIVIAFGLLIWGCTQPDKTQGSQNDIDRKVDSLMAMMTIEEKIGQLNMPSAGDITTGLKNSTGIVPKIKSGQVGALLNIRGVEKIHEAQRLAVEESRMKIPLIFALDVIHGYKTLFPIPLGLSATWNMDMIEQSARVAAREASADGIALTFSPMVDIARDPRWGRIAEGAGEDPYLASQMAVAMVNGYQGEDLTANNTLMACVKHLGLYGAAEGGRDYNTVDMSRERMFNDYFPPYKAAVDAGVGSAMASFNDVDAIPATGNQWLLTNVLRDRWKFDGFVVSDYTGINEMTPHGIGDLQEVAAVALKAGLDLDMVGEGFLSTLYQSYKEGRITEADIDQACRRILEAKYKLGLFENPYQYGSAERVRQEVFTEENRAFAREVAQESMVLLKNENDLLPLSKSGTIGLIGPLSDNAENMSGTWSVAGDFDKCVSLLDGIKNVVGTKAKILHAKGSNIYRDEELEARISIHGKPTYRSDRPESEMIAEAMEVARKSDVVIAALGEASEMAGESSSRTDIGIPDVQLRLLKELKTTGKPIVLVLFAGRPMTLEWEHDNVPSILNTWFAGTEAGNAIADVLFGDAVPSGKLTATFPRNIGQIPIYHSMKNTGRPLPEGSWFQRFTSNYLDVPNTPRYPFGHGLSYVGFEYGEITLSDSVVSGPDQQITATIPVTNRGGRDAKEVVQLYLHDRFASTTRPNMELKGFQKVLIPAGETIEVNFTITPELLKFYKYDPESDFTRIIQTWESGDFDLMIGTSSAEYKMTKFTWKK